MHHIVPHTAREVQELRKKYKLEAPAMTNTTISIKPTKQSPLLDVNESPHAGQILQNCENDSPVLEVDGSQELLLEQSIQPHA